FVPDEDQGYFPVIIQAPPGASADYVRQIEDQVSAIMRPMPEVQNIFAITGTLVLCFLPPAIQGLGQFGGFQFEVQDQGSHSLEELASVTQGMVRQGNARKDLTGLYSSYTASDPQFLVTIDREKAKSLHVPLQQITDTLGVYMGSAYVNDFDFNNRS